MIIEPATEPNSGITGSGLVVHLSDPEVLPVLGDSERGGTALGGKGAALARLVEFGLPVPPTGVITTAAYRAVVQPAAEKLQQLCAAAPSDQQVDSFFETLPAPDRLEAEIVQLAKQVGGGGLIAIRSSATVEDLEGFSFAGQYKSFLNIDSESDEQVIAAVRRVWASLWHPAPVAYRRSFAVAEADVAMAVVLMRMIPATTAGVVFTSDPGGLVGCSRIEAVEGLGEALVSGAETPSAWVVPNEPSVGPRIPPLPSEVRRALDLSLEIADRFGVPQDVEWAADGEDVFVVQARPITVLDTDDGLDSAIDDHELTTAGIVEMVPGVLAPLHWELNGFILEEALRSFLDNLGIIRGSSAEDRPFVRRVRGRAAVDLDQLRDAASAIPGAADELDRQYFGESHQPETTAEADGGLARTQQKLSELRQQIRTLRTRGRVTEQADIVIAAAQGLDRQRVDLEALTDEELLAYIQRLVDLGGRGLAAELAVAASSAAAYNRLEELLAANLGPHEAGRQVQRISAGSIASVERSPHGSAAVFGGPTWTELESAPRALPKTNQPSHEENRRQLEDQLRTLPGWKRRRILTGQFVDIRLHVIRRAIAEVREQMLRREQAKDAVLRFGGDVRRAHLELGRRFCERSLLTSANDIELLTTAELASAVAGHPKHRQDVLRRRRNWESRYLAEGPLPVRFVGIPTREPTPLPEGDVLRGWASSPGRWSGRARFLRSPQEDLAPGEVLVATSTDALWSPLFIQAGAVVVEQGGPLSHAAILARELRLPAVLNIPGAGDVLDGCMVTVDGDDGAVVIEERRDASRT